MEAAIDSQVKYAPGSFDWKDGDPAVLGQISGYGAVLKNIDLHNDIIEPGAFEKTLREHTKDERPIRMFWQHYEPVGMWDKFEEDSKGLKLSGVAFINEVQAAKEAYTFAKHKIATGLSIGYREKLVEFDNSQRVRHIKELELLEVSIVMQPANPLARITGIKNDLARTSIHEFERILCDAGYSRREAKAIATHGFAGLVRRDAENSSELLEALVSLQKNLHI